MAIANGGTGFIGNRFVRLWFVGKLLGRNTKYQVAESAPDLFLIGSAGGGEAYAFDLAKVYGAVYQVPFIRLDPKEAWLAADSFDVFPPRTNLYQVEICSKTLVPSVSRVPSVVKPVLRLQNDN